MHNKFVPKFNLIFNFPRKKLSNLNRSVSLYVVKYKIIFHVWLFQSIDSPRSSVVVTEIESIQTSLMVEA